MVKEKTQAGTGKMGVTSAGSTESVEKERTSYGEIPRGDGTREIKTGIRVKIEVRKSTRNALATRRGCTIKEESNS